MRQRRAPTALALLVAAALVALAGLHEDRADALSCVGEEAVLVGAERAFIGELVARDDDRLTFRVTDAMRGELPAEVVVRDELADAFPMGVEPGREVGLVARVRGDELVANACGLVRPARLRETRERGWPTGAAAVHTRRAVVRRGVARVEVGCLGRCTGTLVLRGERGARLAERRIALRAGVTRVPVRLTPTAQRRLRRPDGGRLRARLAVRLCPGGAETTARVTLTRGVTRGD